MAAISITCQANAAALTTSFLPAQKIRSPLSESLPVLRSSAKRRGQIVAAGKVHTVAPGETLWKIAQAEGVKLADLKAENMNILNKDQVYPGQTITIPGKTVATVGHTGSYQTNATQNDNSMVITLVAALLGAALFTIIRNRNSDER